MAASREDSCWVARSSLMLSLAPSVMPSAYRRDPRMVPDVFPRRPCGDAMHWRGASPRGRVQGGSDSEISMLEKRP